MLYKHKPLILGGLMKRFKKPLTILSVSILTMIFGGLFVMNSFSSPAGEFVPDRLLVKFYPNVSLERIDAINGMLGGKIESEFRLDPDLFLIGLSGGSDLDKAFNDFLSFTEVRYAEKDLIYHVIYIPNDTYFDKLRGMHNTGQTGGKNDYESVLSTTTCRVKGGKGRVK